MCLLNAIIQPTFGQLCIYVIIAANPSIRRTQKTYNFWVCTKLCTNERNSRNDKRATADRSQH